MARSIATHIVYWGWLALAAFPWRAEAQSEPAPLPAAPTPEPATGWMPGAPPEPVGGKKADAVVTVSKPLWEVGVGVGALSFPTYRGAAQRSNYLLPLPYVVYRGQFLRADRDGARAVFVDAGRVEVDLSLSGTPPIRHSDSGARAGMGRLPATFELGPNVNVDLWRSNEHRMQLDLRLPLRTAFTVQRSPSGLGFLFEPKLNLDVARVAGNVNLDLGAGPLFASRRYNAHYYDVTGDDVRPGRPAYEAGGGYGGWQALAAVSQRYDGAFVGAFVRYDHVGGAVFDGSPLVEHRATLALGVAVAWTFATSGRSVQVPLEH